MHVMYGRGRGCNQCGQVIDSSLRGLVYETAGKRREKWLCVKCVALMAEAVGKALANSLETTNTKTRGRALERVAQQLTAQIEKEERGD